MPHSRLMDFCWNRDRVRIELHSLNAEAVYAMAFAAATAALHRRMKRMLRERKRFCVERDPRVALDGEVEGVLRMPQQIKALDMGAQAAFSCALTDTDRAFTNEWWMKEDQDDEEQARREDR